MTGESLSGHRGPLPLASDRDGAPRSLVLLRAALGAIGFAVVAEAVLGAAGALGAALPVVVAGWLAGGAWLWRRAGSGAGHRCPAPGGPVAGDVAGRPWSGGEVVAVAAVGFALLARAWEGVHRDHFTYDVLSYHLHLPASWRAAGRLSIVPTPFGDQAPAYAPSNAELLYQLLLSATGNVRLAHAGQAPLAALACLAIFAGTRTAGAGRTVAAGSALAFLLVPEIWQQAGGAMTDLSAAAFFLAAVPFLVRCGSVAPAAADVVGAALAIGLLVGTKYVGAVLAAPLATWALALLLRRKTRPRMAGDQRARALAVALGPVIVLATGGFWYVRNAVVTGDPIFPVTLEVPAPFGAWTLARGLYGGAAMRAWTYHLPVANLQPLLEIVTEIGWGFLAGAAMGGVALLARRRPAWPALLAACLALAWLVVPYQQSRFFFGAWGVAALMMGAPAMGGGRSLLPVIVAVGGGALQFPTGARVVAAGAYALAALVTTRPDLRPARAGGWLRGFRFTWLAGRLRRRPAWGWAVLLGAAVTGVLATRAFPGDVAYAIGDHHDAGWDFARQHLHGRRIAYAGSNLPLPLWGWRLDNDVRYVNVKGGPDERLLERAPREAAPATSSAEPAPERAAPDRGAWLANLAHHRIDTLFVAALYPAVAEGMPHDDEDFPTERAWADALPARFTLRFASSGVRVYDVRPGAPLGLGRPARP